MVRPSTQKFEARVTMNDGSPVLTTASPLTRPTSAPATSAIAMTGQIGRWKKVVPIATIIDAAPTVEPIDRSNSPAIIRSPTGSATMPSSAERFSQPAVPLIETKPEP